MPRTNRRSFLARGAALAAVPTITMLACGAPAAAESADPLPGAFIILESIRLDLGYGSQVQP